MAPQPDIVARSQRVPDRVLWLEEAEPAIRVYGLREQRLPSVKTPRETNNQAGLACRGMRVQDEANEVTRLGHHRGCSCDLTILQK